jgi:hypothetical protein
VIDRWQVKLVVMYRRREGRLRFAGHVHHLVV